MRTFLIAAAILAALTAGLWLIPRHDGDLDDRITTLPWQVKPLDDGTSLVFDLRLGVATLDDAIRRFGEPESMALFTRSDGQRSLESYFGTVRFGPLEARVIAVLAADEDLLDALAANATGREGTRSGDSKLLLADADKARLVSQRISGLTYIPAYGGLDADFFRQRLGAPDSWRQEDEHAVSWFYPRLGLALLIDAGGKEAFEYVAPRDFRVPPDAISGSP